MGGRGGVGCVCANVGRVGGILYWEKDYLQTGVKEVSRN